MKGASSLPYVRSDGCTDLAPPQQGSCSACAAALAETAHGATLASTDTLMRDAAQRHVQLREELPRTQGSTRVALVSSECLVSMLEDKATECPLEIAVTLVNDFAQDSWLRAWHAPLERFQRHILQRAGPSLPLAAHVAWMLGWSHLFALMLIALTLQGLIAYFVEVYYSFLRIIAGLSQTSSQMVLILVRKVPPQLCQLVAGRFATSKSGCPRLRSP